MEGTLVCGDTGTEGTAVWRGQGHEWDKGMEETRVWRGHVYGGDRAWMGQRYGWDTGI